MVDDDRARSDQWRALLTGEDPSLRRSRMLWRHVPSAPRCKICAAPFGGLGGPVARALRSGPTRENGLLCRPCFSELAKHPGGAEIEISVVFADVRGSTGLAERVSAGEFRTLLQDYYRLAAGAIDQNGGIIDKFLGDGVMSLFIPVITGENHARRAIEAGQAILAAVEDDGLSAKGLLVGAGVHTGEAFVGAIGAAEKLDFTALGDTVNVAARLGGIAGPRELLVSGVAWERARLGEAPATRQVVVAGRTGSVSVVSLMTPAATRVSA
jgi:adenylate cyclase